MEKLANGVYYVKGGSHHSVAIDQRDHIVVVEAPQNEARSAAVIAKVKETIPNKPIRYVINTHHHFDHSGGLRTYVDEGATVVTHALNKPYYERAWAAPRTINPDKLASSNKSATFETFTRQARDDRRPQDDRGPSHRRQRPQRRVRDGVPPGGKDSDRSGRVCAARGRMRRRRRRPTRSQSTCYENIQRLKLDVRQIAALHGPRVATLADLRVFIGQPNTAP